MGNGDHCAGILLQMLLQPSYGLGIQMVGRLVEQQNIWLFEQQTAHGNAPSFTTRQRLDQGIGWRTA